MSRSIEFLFDRAGGMRAGMPAGMERGVGALLPDDRIGAKNAAFVKIEFKLFT